MSRSNLSLAEAIELAQERYSAANPASRVVHDEARRVFPGGTSRSVLHYEPFALRIASGMGAYVWDADGHRYVDCVGEFSAGLYGHSDPVIKAAITRALDDGIVLGGPNLIEAKLGEAVCSRFPSIELVRFCNSGTEANILALVSAIAFTGRRKVLVFREAYHGGVLSFGGGGSPINLPFECTLADYNDMDTSVSIRKQGSELAAVIVEPILGAAGNIPGTPEFLRSLRDATRETGTLLIFDEVKTSRCGPGGIQGQLGIAPDLTTLGKYLGGGLPSGAFGGRRDIMERYDQARPGAWRHAGTFNNNVCAMAAGLAGLTQVFTKERASTFLRECEAFRSDLNQDLKHRELPMQLTGLGSLMSIHFTPGPISTPADIPAASSRLAQLLHLECLLKGVELARRGDMFLSLPMDEQHRQAIRQALWSFIDEHESLIRREADNVDQRVAE